MSLCKYSNFLGVTTSLILDKAESLLDRRGMSDIILRTGNVIIYQLQTAVLFMTVPKVIPCFCIPTKTFDSTLRFCKFKFILLRCAF